METLTKVSLLAVDEMHMNLPHMTKDVYWNDCDARPPYTLAAADSCIPSFLGSTTDMGSISFMLLFYFETRFKFYNKKLVPIVSSRLSDILQFDDIDVSDSRPPLQDPVLIRRQESVLGRVRRLLSVQEPPDLRPPRPIFKRHSSDATGSFFPDFRLNAGADDVAPPFSLVTPPTPVDTLSTLREVSSNLPSPETSPSAFFPQFVVSPPLTGDVCYDHVEVTKPQNGLDPSPTDEAPGSVTQRAGSSFCYSPTQLGPKEFQWTTLQNVQSRPPPRPRGRQFSLQFSRQTSKSSVRSLPSPKALGRQRRGLARFQSRRTPAPSADTLQLPDPEYDHNFQGIAGTEDEVTNNNREVENNDNCQSRSSEEK
ncbi:putative bestrophin-3 [Scophthalmus maximus]|nr:putative bestrophin-3 [Scophthalmus maximus]